MLVGARISAQQVRALGAPPLMPIVVAVGATVFLALLILGALLAMR